MDKPAIDNGVATMRYERDVRRYLVTWEFDGEDCDNPVAAARQAWEAMRAENSAACVFKVYDSEGIDHLIDLAAIDDGDACAACGSSWIEGGRCEDCGGEVVANG